VTPQKTKLRNMFLHSIWSAPPPVQIGVGTIFIQVGTTFMYLGFILKWMAGEVSELTSSCNQSGKADALSGLISNLHGPGMAACVHAHRPSRISLWNSWNGETTSDARIQQMRLALRITRASHTGRCRTLCS